MLYPITEITYDIQGEGCYSGTPALFIRFAYCNLNCSWCDVNHDHNCSMPEVVLSSIGAWSNIPLLVLTGGEPTIQPLYPLLKKLRQKNADQVIAIETNGMMPEELRKYKDNDLIDWITVSPKLLTSETKLSIAMADEVIVVYHENNSPDRYQPFLEDQFIKGHAFIQPCSDNLPPAIEYVKKHPFWRLSYRIQKHISGGTPVTL